MHAQKKQDVRQVARIYLNWTPHLIEAVGSWINICHCKKPKYGQPHTYQLLAWMTNYQEVNSTEKSLQNHHKRNHKGQIPIAMVTNLSVMVIHRSKFESALNLA